MVFSCLVRVLIRVSVIMSVRGFIGFTRVGIWFVTGF